MGKGIKVIHFFAFFCIFSCIFAKKVVPLQRYFFGFYPKTTNYFFGFYPEITNYLFGFCLSN